MPIMLFPKCHRGRADCMPIHCLDAVDDSRLTDEQVAMVDYTPESFVCCGRCSDPALPQDVYRHCFKNAETDHMSDNDIQDLAHMASVVTAALAYDATMRVNSGSVEVPAVQGEETTC